MRDSTMSLSVYPQKSDMTAADCDATKLDSAFITDDLIDSLREDILKERDSSFDGISTTNPPNNTPANNTPANNTIDTPSTPKKEQFIPNEELNETTVVYGVSVGVLIGIALVMMLGTSGTVLFGMLILGLLLFKKDIQKYLNMRSEFNEEDEVNEDTVNEDTVNEDTVEEDTTKEQYKNAIAHPNVGVRGSKKEPVTFSDSLYMSVDSLVAKSQQERNQTFNLVQDSYLNTDPAVLFYGKNVNRHIFI